MIPKIPQAPNRKFKKVESEKVSMIDLYPEQNVLELAAERKGLDVHQSNVKPLVDLQREEDPRGVSAVAVTKAPKVFQQLLKQSAKGSLDEELNKHHLQRASHRLSEASRKQKFDELINHYFYVGKTQKAQQTLASLLNTPIRPLTEPELQSIEQMIRTHDARLLNDSNALLHIINSTLLLQDIRKSLTSDQWSSLLRYALLSLYRRSSQVPPDWLGTVYKDASTTPGSATPDETFTHVVSEEGKTESVDPTAAHITEAAVLHPETSSGDMRIRKERGPNSTLGIEKFKTFLMENLRNDARFIQTAKGILTGDVSLPPKALSAFGLSGLTSGPGGRTYEPERLTYSDADEIILETIRGMTGKVQGMTKKWFEEYMEARTARADELRSEASTRRDDATSSVASSEAGGSSSSDTPGASSSESDVDSDEILEPLKEEKKKP